jgi:type IV pilus assembly protein PilW
MSTRSMWRRGMSSRHKAGGHADASGFTLIELMIAMLLGLIVVAGVVSVFLATQRSYRTNEALGDVQDSSRIAFELMAHDIRDASLTGCTNNGKIGNILKNGPVAGGTMWWAKWANAIHGYRAVLDPAPTALVPKTVGTDSLMLLGTEDLGLTINVNVDATHFTTNATTAATLQAGDIAVVCDPVQATIFQVTSVLANSVEHAGSGSSPGNCSQGLDYRTVCTAAGNAYNYGPNAQVARLTAVDWYLGTNPDGGSSLYRVSLASGGSLGPAMEMVRNVSRMILTYHQAPTAGFVPSDSATPSVTNWAAVDAVEVTLTVASTDTYAGTNGLAISRSFTATTTLRNRVK